MSPRSLRGRCGPLKAAACSSGSRHKGPAVIDISYLVINWNTKDLTGLCIRSLAADSRGFDAEIIVVDNGSEDGSIEMIRAQFPAVHLICNDRNVGFARANNIGMLKSRGRFVFLVNSDAQLVPGCTGSMIGCMRDNPGLALLGPGILDSEGRPQQNCWEFPSLPSVARGVIGVRQPGVGRMQGGGGLVHLTRHFLSGCVLMVRREALERDGLFDERYFFYAEDMDWSRRMIDGGWMIGQLPAAKAIHYGGGSSTRNGTRAAVQAERALFQYFRKNRPDLLVAMRFLRLVHHANRVVGNALLRAARIGDCARCSRAIQEGRAVITWLLLDAGGRHG
jgi:GT2 family glycosyltransferase